ncbi:MAG: T9SS type A sorting domain-containing protein [Bacteroidales bacterium]|nr:T9SS type A sorting domain-containing protein [Bacteroidales bacterium]
MKRFFVIIPVLCFFFCSSIDVFGSTAGSMGRLDSIIYQLNNAGKVRKAIYHYVDNKLVDITDYEATDLSSNWNPYRKTIFSLNNGIETTIVQVFENLQNSFVNSTKSELQFDSQGNRTLEAYYLWNGTTSAWKGFRKKMQRNYIDTGVISSYTYSNWDSIANNWKAFSQGSISYTLFKKPDVMLYSAPDANGVMISTSKITNSYLPNNNPEYETTYTYDTNTSSFLPTLRRHFEYADVAPQFVETVAQYSSTAQSWKNLQLTTKSYTPQGNLLQFIVSDRDTIGQTWKERYRHDFSILSNTTDSINIAQTDAPDGVSLYTKNYKQINNGTGDSNETNTVEQNGTLISTQNVHTNTASGDLTEYSNQDQLENITLSWVIDSAKSTLACNYFQANDIEMKSKELISSMTLYFNPNPTKIPKVLEDNKLNFWPNPVTDLLNITNNTSSLVTYRIFSLEGKSLLGGEAIETTTSIGVTSLKAGAYILQLTTDKNKTKTKVFLKK